MQVHRIDPDDIDAALIAEAAAVLRAGGLVAFPTETVYGLGADATNAHAIRAIYATKGRPAYNPLIVHAADIDGARRAVREWPATAAALAAHFWPGPLTMVLPKAPMIVGEATAGLDTVGVRVPAHPVASALLRAADLPIAAPSANPSMGVSPTEGRHVSLAFAADADVLVLDAGPAAVGIESTVIDLTAAIPTILRPGMIGRDTLSAVIGEVAMRGAADGIARSPGMMDRHYSPRARLVIAAAEGPARLTEALSALGSGERVAVIAHSPFESTRASVHQLPADPAGYARALYATLHALDGEGVSVILVEPVPDEDAWGGVRDRLERAATQEEGG